VIKTYAPSTRLFCSLLTCPHNSGNSPTIDTKSSVPNILAKKEEAKKPEPAKSPFQVNPGFALFSYRLRFSTVIPPVSSPKIAPDQNTSSPGKKKEATPSVSSLADDIATKEEFKYDYQVELTAKQWIEQVLTVKCEGGFTPWIKTGVILCQSVLRAKI